MANKSKSAGQKKKHVSKHVLKAREDKSKAVAESLSGERTPTSSDNQKRKQKKNRHVKSLSEVSAYLQQWKESKSGKDTRWKFNKNTQSWLIRHMYEAEKIPKNIFVLLLDYLEGIEGNTTRTWIRADASRRALRYKQCQKDIENGVDEDKEEKDKAQKGRRINEEEKKSLDEQEEESRWKNLSDHDKRKEYKRARKVLDTVTEKTNS